ncbi:MAG: GNAT family N-acetyltransferase [Cyanobacteriota bacterium]|nr:GNAT family N-acetyltransferase [Cyanobacteriota bacterium]
MDKKAIQIRLVHNESEQQALYFQRWLVLRSPLGLPQGSEQDKYEHQSVHLIAILDNQVVGSVRLRILASQIGSLAYLAVLPQFQRQGIGSQLVKHLIQVAQNRGLPTVRAMARKEMLGFYQKLGFEPKGDEVEFLGKPHQFVYLQL